MPEIARKGPREKVDRLADPDVRRWYENVARGSEITASNYLRSLFNFGRQMDTTPNELVRVSADRAYELLLDFVGLEEKRGLAGSAIAVYVKAVRSWLAFRGVRVDRRIKIRGANLTPTLSNEQVPDQETLRSILLAATSQQRVAISLVAFAGVRLEVIGNFRGTDGLKLRDLSDLRIEKKAVRFESLPARVVVRSELSKTGKQYFTFIGREGSDYIAAYLGERLRGGEKLGPDSDMFHPHAHTKRFVRTINVGDAIRSAIRRAGCSFRPYTLRAYFDTQLLLAESKGKVARDYRVFWMGHAGTMESRYTTHKGRLPKDLVDDMTAAYRRCEPFLSTTQTAEEKETGKRLVKFEILAAVGVPPDEAEKLLDDPKTDIGAVIRRRLSGPGQAEAQRIVSLEEARPLLGQGWTVHTAVGSQLVLDPPGR